MTAAMWWRQARVGTRCSTHRHVIMRIRTVQLLEEPVVALGGEPLTDVRQYLETHGLWFELERGRFRVVVVLEWQEKDGYGALEEWRVYEFSPEGVFVVYADCIHPRDTYLVLSAQLEGARFHDATEAEYQLAAYIRRGRRFRLDGAGRFPTMLHIYSMDEFGKLLVSLLSEGVIRLGLLSLESLQGYVLEASPDVYSIDLGVPLIVKSHESDRRGNP